MPQLHNPCPAVPAAATPARSSRLSIDLYLCVECTSSIERGPPGTGEFYPRAPPNDSIVPYASSSASSSRKELKTSSGRELHCFMGADNAEISDINLEMSRRQELRTNIGSIATGVPASHPTPALLNALTAAAKEYLAVRRRRHGGVC